uniref:Uncharacterized protein n=1 Tax=Anguilla anguilla TaxID=7936 RepID=A0A0E9TP12_ANGAN
MALLNSSLPRTCCKGKCLLVYS